MKHILSILLLLTIGFTACQRNAAYPLAMQQAEKLMNTRPDSALTLLESMSDSLAMLPEEARMYYHLLTIQAKDKQYITHTGDSLINQIVSYYEESENKERLMMAYYYQGRVYRDMNDAPRALKAFHQTMELNIPNNDLLAKVFSQMGYLFSFQGLYDEAIAVNRQAMKLNIKQGNQAPISYTLRDIARMYDAKHKQDSALFYYKEAYKMALAIGDSARYYGILGEVGGFHLKIGNIDTAKNILLKVEKKRLYFNKSYLYLCLGGVYEKMGQLDSAHHYYQKTLST